jgi:drug/metabolite transporter (DMT)-like permease
LLIWCDFNYRTALMDTPLSTALSALSAAAAWGSGDFAGGLAARRVGPFRTVLISYSVGLLALVITALARSEQLPPPADLRWGALAGFFGMAGLGFLLRGFTAGRMGIVAPVSAVLATAIPVVFAALTEGLPGELQLLGFGLALVSIWLLSRPETLSGRPAGLGEALLAGLGFGGFFIALGQIGESAVFWPLVAGRLTACALMAAFALSTRRPINPPQLPLGLLVLSGTLDVGGNLFFLLAVQSGRLDVAAVLGSLYPAVTAILAWLITREHMTNLQVIGVAAAVLAIVLITL